MKRYLVKFDTVAYNLYDGYRTTIWIYYYSDGDIELVKSRVKI